jgi:hypothetical protein
MLRMTLWLVLATDHSTGTSREKSSCFFIREGLFVCGQYSFTTLALRIELKQPSMIIALVLLLLFQAHCAHRVYRVPKDDALIGRRLIPFGLPAFVYLFVSIERAVCPFLLEMKVVIRASKS